MKLTAVDWYANELNSLNAAYENGEISYVNYHVYKGHLLEQAKQMEKQQKKKDFEKGYECGVGDYIDCENGFDCKSSGFEEYYNTEYGGEK